VGPTAQFARPRPADLDDPHLLAVRLSEEGDRPHSFASLRLMYCHRTLRSFRIALFTTSSISLLASALTADGHEKSSRRYPGLLYEPDWRASGPRTSRRAAVE